MNLFPLILKYFINLVFIILLLPGCNDKENTTAQRPVKIIFDTDPGSDYDDIGEKIKTGLRLINSDIKNSPVKDTYRIGMPLSGDLSGRMSWDQTAVLIGVYGTEGYFETVRGIITVNADGSNTWEDNPAGNHYYVKQKMPVDEMTIFIEERMMYQGVIK
ncbi:MAG: hypothetical protein A2X05_17815 [Bacteroidetes bacterium GWE2_41_25]|nr:MAG: hypothetical protein A2X03_10090 [Bacteroidetes bacterium GWA2_40_15]OFX93872.1 MAG: hypothetical protein A2X05_17815 [Bacteroidetes bacterium GWE2_41_25]OFX99545.1 MAG: hypothetical protein A2X06_10640 [Bacteroidetes bacterium GWC2_40_22]OFY57718.1 MAG: hypothetical protein A2X04_03710 [Bacteroidetes bacterium GWF2_41_9]HAM09874.1 hypothetical protein [Bacteroidales bacterium]